MLILIVALYTICYLYYKYYATLFSPSRRIIEKPNDITEITLESHGYKLKLWEKIINDGFILIYFHGNNLNISHRQYVISLASLLNINLILPDYRGFGCSEGYSTVHSFLRDTETIYKYASSKQRKIIVWGESLGGFAASHCAALYQPEKLILFNTFFDIKFVAPAFLRPMFSWFPNLNTEKYLSKYKGSSLVIHSREDSYISFEQAEKNYSLLSNAEFLEIGGDHSMPHFTLKNFKNMVEFLKLPLPEDKKALLWIESAKKGFSS